ncbi:MAG: tRNA-intron lyase [Desulfurococcales archaeon]|jgi:tRNA-intron endonuclease|nr:tRNA-intron lyase [Desulfurococcales archaeon]
MSGETPRVNMMIIGGKALIFDHKISNELYSKHFIGKPFGEKKPKIGVSYKGPLELTLLEAVYLCEKNIALPIKDREKIDCETLKNYAASKDPRFLYTYKVFKDLREKGYVIRSGMKYGVDYAVYEKGPGLEHAPYLVHVFKYDEEIDPIHIVRLGRLSHSVRKNLVIAIVYDNTIKYISFGWIRF